MFRGPQILTWSCPFRSLLSLRESHFAACCENTGWQSARAAKERRHEVGSLSSTETLSCSTQLPLFISDCNNQELKDASVQNLSKAISSSRHPHPSQVSAAAKARQAVSIYQDCLINTTCFQPWRRSRDFGQTPLSFTNKPQRTVLQSHSHDKEHFVRPFSLSSHQPWILNHLHWKARPSGISFHQTRAAYHSARNVAGAWRSCLTPENENRCRQNLGPNLKLYEADGGRKGASQSQGKRQAKWASVLVSLCSVEGEPAFLFTLRSSTLKGRHKGDVSFAGGKCDPSDTDVVATALREAREELGVNVATERVWGILKPLRDSSGMMIAPVLANLGPLEELSFKPNPGEVEEIFTLSLSHLCNPQNCGYTHFRTGDKYGYTLPVFRNGKHRVWGLTAVALQHTLSLIVPKVDFQ